MERKQWKTEEKAANFSQEYFISQRQLSVPLVSFALTETIYTFSCICIDVFSKANIVVNQQIKYGQADVIWKQKIQ